MRQRQEAALVDLRLTAVDRLVGKYPMNQVDPGLKLPINPTRKRALRVEMQRAAVMGCPNPGAPSSPLCIFAPMRQSLHLWVWRHVGTLQSSQLLPAESGAAMMALDDRAFPQRQPQQAPHLWHGGALRHAFAHLVDVNRYCAALECRRPPSRFLQRTALTITVRGVQTPHPLDPDKRKFRASSLQIGQLAANAQSRRRQHIDIGQKSVETRELLLRCRQVRQSIFTLVWGTRTIKGTPKGTPSAIVESGRIGLSPVSRLHHVEGACRLDSPSGTDGDHHV